MIEITEVQRVLSAEEAEQYAHCFERQYWVDGLPVVQPRQHDLVLADRLSPRGRRTVERVVKGNGGMLRPAVEACVTEGVLYASDLDAGRVVKVVSEGLVRRHYDASPEMAGLDLVEQPSETAYLAHEAPSASGVTVVNDGAYDSYSTFADWYIVADNMRIWGDSQRSFFPLGVDYHASYDAGPRSDVANAVRVTGIAPRNGQTAIELDVTAPTEPLGYRRSLRAVIGEPVIVPGTSDYMSLRHRH